MNNNTFSLKIVLVLILLLFQNCQSQSSDNAFFIGKDFGSFDIDKAKFNEDVTNLFSKIPHVEIEKEINVKKMKVFRVKTDSQNNDLFNYFNIKDGDVEFYVDNKNNLVMIYDMVLMSAKESSEFMNTIRNKYKTKEIISKKNKFIDDSFLMQDNNKLTQITKTCMQGGDCTIIYKIYKTPQKEEDVLRFLTPSPEIESLLKK